MNLGGLRVLITRPRGRGETLAAAIRESGGSVVEVPLLAVEALDPQRDGELCNVADNYLRALDSYDVVIVISVNAVAMGLERATKFWLDWPTRPRWYAIGTATAEALQQWDIDAIAPNGGMYSEALLAQPELQRMRGQRVLIIRGLGGRETLAMQLQARGAQVDYAECYRRVEPQLSANERAALAQPVDAICVNSAETLANLWNNLATENRAQICEQALIVPSVRVGDQASALGFTRVVIAANAGTTATLAALATLTSKQ